MTTRTPHPGDLLQEWLDGRLDPARSAEIEAHLAECPACREERDALAAARELVREALPSRDLPARFETELRASLASEREAGRRDGPIGAGTADAAPADRFAGRTVGWALVAAALLVLALYVSWRGGSADVVSSASRVFDVQQERDAALDLATAEAADLERFFNARLGFRIKVYDLEAMGYRLVGGRIAEVAGRETSIAVYEAPDGRRLVCLMFLGGTGDLPAGDDRLSHDGIPFYVYREQERTLVFWPEGNLVCALVSSLAAEEVIEVAFAKAENPAP